MKFAFWSVVAAQSRPPVLNGGILPGPSDDAQAYVAETVLPGIANTLLVYILGIAVIMILVAGFMFLLSAGEEERRTKAVRIMVWTTAGTALAILAYGIVQFVVTLNY